MSRASIVCSPFPRTARKQSKLQISPSEPSEGKLHMEAVVHAQERTNRHSSNFIRQSLKVTSGQTTTTASDSKLRVGNRVVNTGKLMSSLKHVPSSVKATFSRPKPSTVSLISAAPSDNYVIYYVILPKQS